jgi:hypothetical protein
MKHSLFCICTTVALCISRLALQACSMRCRSAQNLVLMSALTTLASATMAQATGTIDPDEPISAAVVRSLLRNLVHSGFTSNGNPDGTQMPSEATWAPGNSPEVTIVGGDKTLPDSDAIPGELVSFTGTATVTSGTITSTEWLIDDNVVATGTTTTLALNDGTTGITFRATDDDGFARTASVTYTVVPPSSQLPRIGSINIQQMPRGSQFSIAVRDSNSFIVSIAPISQTFDISGFIYPQTIDAFFAADIFVVASTPAGWLMRNLDGFFVPWNGDFGSLVPAYEEQRLTSPLRVNMFAGKFPAPGTYELYLAYMRTDSGELIYTADPRRVNITAQ